MTGPYETASTVFAEAGVVYVDGPGCVVYAMTPDAALETSDRLLEGVATARGQQVSGQLGAATDELNP